MLVYNCFINIYIIYQHTRLKGTHTDQTDYDMETKYWTHPAHSIKILEEDEQSKGTLQVFTDGSKSQEGVGSGIAIYDQDSLIQTLKYKLNRNCTNNQAEQLAILKALQFAEKYLNNYKTATIYTDSRITLDSLRRRRHHAYLIEEVRRQVTSMQQNNWNVEFSWVKAHIGIQGNETADRLAKEAAESRNIMECYSKNPKSLITSELKSKSEQKWQREWDQTTKGAITKSFLPNISDRQKLKLKLTRNFTTIVTGHGNIRTYLSKFKIIDNPICPCKTSEQTVDHLIFNCKLLNKEREKLKTVVTRKETWPVQKDRLLKHYTNLFTMFTNAIPFDEL